jgi:hypothetical protein
MTHAGDYATTLGQSRGKMSTPAPWDGMLSSTRRACSSASSSSQAETERQPRKRAARAHRRASA